LKFRDFLLILSLGLGGCTTPEIQDLNVDPVYVIEGWFSDSLKIQSVRISTSTNFGENKSSTPVLNAQVKISELFERESYDLNHISEGIYKSSVPIKAIIGYSYQLEVVLSNGEAIVSQFQSINDISIIDSLYYGFYIRENPDAENPEETVYYPIVRTSDSFDVNNFYRWRAYKNDTLLTDPSEIETLSDQFFDGNTIEHELINLEFELNDTLVLEQQQLSPSAYSYMNLIKQQTTLLGTVNSTSPAQINGNLNYLNIDNPVLGYWGVISVQLDSLIIF